MLPQQTEVSLAVSRAGDFQLRSAQLREAITYREGEHPPHRLRQLSIHGCIELFRERHPGVPPLAILVDSAVPIGAGLSSSAALEVATLRALRARFAMRSTTPRWRCSPTRPRCASPASAAGIMDQMVSSLGSPNHMLFLDTRSLERSAAAAAARVRDNGRGQWRAALARGERPTTPRRTECETAAAPWEFARSRDVLDVSLTSQLEPPLDRRARHVVTENARVLQARRGSRCESTFGTLMNESHASLRDDFEVSTAELDQLVALLQSQPQVHGARLTGAGFGGACVALLREGEAAQRSVRR